MCWVAGGDGGMQPSSCPNRGESRPMNDANKSLVLQNYFRDDPNENLSCVDNSANLENMLDVCYKASGNRWTNFLAVDFYKVCHLFMQLWWLVSVLFCQNWLYEIHMLPYGNLLVGEDYWMKPHKLIFHSCGSRKNVLCSTFVDPSVVN